MAEEFLGKLGVMLESREEDIVGMMEALNLAESVVEKEEIVSG